jgi:uncharacterized membrane protein
VKHTSWFGIIALYTVVTLLFVYFIPNDSPFSVLTNIFGFVFVAVVPGYCLVNLLFKDGKLDIIEKAVLSVALSFSIAGMSGLFLGLSPIGMTTAALTISLSTIVMVLAFLALIRKRKQQLQIQNPEQTSQ